MVDHNEQPLVVYLALIRALFPVILGLDLFMGCVLQATVGMSVPVQSTICFCETDGCGPHRGNFMEGDLAPNPALGAETTTLYSEPEVWLQRAEV